jgi:hypothetical protein
MKWYFALSAASLGNGGHDWPSLIRVSVSSARRNTTLQPHLIWDGPEHPFLDELRAHGVAIIFHRVRCYGALYHHNPSEVFLKTASGCFLRIDIPVLEVLDPFVLYTDADVIFLRDPVPALSRLTPEFFAAAPEFHREDAMNSGVMLLNVRQMQNDYGNFQQFIRDNLWRGLDQEMYRTHYASRYAPLDPSFNWKPYWGFNAGAAILHWHGVKPVEVRQYLAGGYALHPDLAALIERDRTAYAAYLDVFAHYLKLYEAAPRPNLLSKHQPAQISRSAWQVDLGSCAVIQEIHVYNMTGDTEFTLAVSIDGAAWVELFLQVDDAAADAKPFIWNGPGAAWARYVRVTLPGEDALPHLDQIEVYGHLP